MKQNNKSIKAPKVNPKLKADYTKSLRVFNNNCNKSLKWWLLSRFNGSTSTAQALYKEFSKLSNYWVNKAEVELTVPIEKMINKSLKQSDNYLKKQNIKFDDKIKPHELRDVIKAQINANLALIKSIPRENILRYENVLYQAISNYDQESVLKQIKNIGDISDRRAKTIARDQVKKAQETLNLARAKTLGFEYFKWVTMRDERVSTGKGGHKHLNGRIYKIDEPTAIIDSYGNKGKPSDRVNCRCTSALIYLEPNQEVELIKDSEHGDYYKIVDKLTSNHPDESQHKISKSIHKSTPKPQSKPIENIPKLELNADNIKDIDREVIDFYTVQGYRDLRRIAENRDTENFTPSEKNKLKKYLKRLDDMFDEYKSNIEPATHLYRGMSFDDNAFNKFYTKIKKGNDFILDKNFISSFTTDSIVAKEFAQPYREERNTIIIDILSDGNDELDIMNFSKQYGEYEVILRKGTKMKIKEIKQENNKYGGKTIRIIAEKVKNTGRTQDSKPDEKYFKDNTFILSDWLKDQKVDYSNRFCPIIK